MHVSEKIASLRHGQLAGRLMSSSERAPRRVYPLGVGVFLYDVGMVYNGTYYTILTDYIRNQRNDADTPEFIRQAAEGLTPAMISGEDTSSLPSLRAAVESYYGVATANALREWELYVGIQVQGEDIILPQTIVGFTPKDRNDENWRPLVAYNSEMDPQLESRLDSGPLGAGGWIDVLLRHDPNWMAANEIRFRESMDGSVTEFGDDPLGMADARRYADGQESGATRSQKRRTTTKSRKAKTKKTPEVPASPRPSLEVMTAEAYAPSYLAKLATSGYTVSDVPANLRPAFGPALDSFRAIDAYETAVVQKDSWRAMTVEERARLYFTAMATKDVNQRRFVGPSALSNFHYTLSILNPKPDPLGRYVLCDVFSGTNAADELFVDHIGHYATVVITYAGVAGTPFVLGLGGPNPHEAMNLLGPKGEEDPISGDYLRMHSADGVKLKFAGYGTCVYGATAVAATFGDRYRGIWSAGRTPEAEDWWTAARARKMAVLASGKGIRFERNRESRSIQLCDTEPSMEVYGFAYDENVFTTKEAAIQHVMQHYSLPRSEAEKFVVKGSVRKSCSTGTVFYPRVPSYEPFDTTKAMLTKPTDMLPAEHILPTGLIPFMIYSESDKSPLLFPNQGTSWNAPMQREQYLTGNARIKLTPPEQHRATYEMARFGDVCANMLARSSFGPSPRLALMILDTLTKGGHTDLAAQYTARKDIAPLIATNPTAMGIIHSRALGGLQRMSTRHYNGLLAGLMEGMEPSHDSENPLNIPPMPANIQRKLDRLAFDG